MTLLFKIIGFALIIFVTTIIGFSKAQSLTLRHKKLCKLIKEISLLREHIRLHGGERETLFKKCFSEYPINHTALCKEEIQTLDDFFNNMGGGDTKTECERCELCIGTLKRQADEAQKRECELARLYKNIGVLSGVLICIFFL